MKKIAYMMIGLVCLTNATFGESRFGPFASWMTSNDEDAFGGGLKYEWFFADNFGVDVRASYLIGDEGNPSDDVYVIPLEIGLVGVLPLDGLSIYAGVGGGYYIPEDYSEGSPWGEVEGPDATFGFYGVLGVRLPITDNIECFVEAKYTKAESDEESNSGPIIRNGRLVGYTIHETTKKGMDLDGVGANAGILWKF